MGIDLSFYLEVKDAAGRWEWRGGSQVGRDEPLHEPLFIPRNRQFYGLFKIRGLPSDVSRPVRRHLRKVWGEPPADGTFSWLTLKELDEMLYWMPAELMYVYEPMVEHIHRLDRNPEDVRIILELA